MPCAQCNEGTSDPASRKGERLAEEIPSLDLSLENCDLGEHFSMSKKIGPALSQWTGRNGYLGLGEDALESLLLPVAAISFISKL